MRCSVVIAILVAVCYAAPLENEPTELVVTAIDLTTAATVAPVMITQTDKIPLPEDKPIVNEPVEELHKIEDRPQVISDTKPILDHPEEKPLVNENSEPEVNPSPPHHVQEHVLEEPSDKPVLHPVLIEQKPELAETETEEDSEEELDALQTLGLLALAYEIEMLEEMDQLMNKNKDRRGHRNNHKHNHRHPKKAVLL